MDMHRLRDHLNLNKYFKSFVPDKDGQGFESWAAIHPDVIRTLLQDGKENHIKLK